MTDLEFTGERFVPSKSPPRLEAEHRARYSFASGYVDGLRVLDIGCGEGYGSHMLSEAAGFVTGIDINEQAIEHALITYKAPNLTFKTADVNTLPFDDNEFDMCVCFEIIEHIKNPERLLTETARVLNPSGIFIVSTPNGAVKVSSRPNPFHIREFTLDEFRALLRERFLEDQWDINIFGQFIEGKNYSALGALMKNFYLDIKASLGIHPKPVSQSDFSPVSNGVAIVEFEFKSEKPDLAEYLIAVVNNREN